MQSSFVIVANHTSHLDAPLLTTLLPLRFRDKTFPIAAQDFFYERLSTAAFSAVFVNAMPLVRGAAGRRGLMDIRERMLSEPTVIIVFPEGTRSRTNTLSEFKAGIGMLVAGTPIPVLPCYLDGAAKAMPVGAKWLRPKRLSIRIGGPLTFEDVSNKRPGWDACARQLHDAVSLLESKPY